VSAGRGPVQIGSVASSAALGIADPLNRRHESGRPVGPPVTGGPILSVPCLHNGFHVLRLDVLKQ
jgi:hypothetical protein